MRAILFVILISLINGQGVLDGCFINELGSNLYMQSSLGSLSGTYETKVGNASGTYPLAGRTTSAGYDAIFGFTVAWVNDAYGNSNSSTSWSGRIVNNGNIQLLTMWLLSSFTSQLNYWDGTQIGQDTFTKVPCQDSDLIWA